MSDWEKLFVWEFEGRLPVLCGNSRGRLTPQECTAAKSVVDQHGLVLFRGFDLSSEDFVRWSEQLSGPHGTMRMAPGASAPSGPSIGLHTEDAMLPTMPAWIWFYAAKPAERGGGTLVCDGASVAAALSAEALSLLTEDILYWWRVSARPPSKEESIVSDPPGISRTYRGPVVREAGDHIEITALCQPLIRSRTGGHRVFGNHILNTIDHQDDGGPPRIDGFHRARTHERRTLPAHLIAELRAVSASMEFCIQLMSKDILWLDNTRFLHGRQAFEGSRYIVVRKGYLASQFLPQRAD